MAKEDNEDRGFQEIDLENPGKVNLDELEAANAAQETRRTIQSGSDLNKHENDDDDDDTPNVVFTDDDDTDDSDEDPPKKVKVPDEEKLKKRTSRAATRIQKLANERNTAKQEADKERRMRLAAEDALRRQAVQSAQATERLLSARLQDLKRQQLSAMENGDNNAVVDISEAIAQTNLDLNVVRRQTANVPPARRGPPPMQQYQQQPQPVNVPEAAVQWGQDNPWFDNPTSIDEAIKADAVKHFAMHLVSQGEDPSDPDFFDQIDEELERRFPAGVVQESTKESAPKQKSQNAPVVGGNPRGQPVARTRPGKKTYRLTADDKQRIDELGITPQQYVKNLQQYENNEGGWTEIAY